MLNEPAEAETVPTTANGPGRRAKLCVEGASVSYGGQRVLSDADLAVEEGEFVSLLGPTGSGKTTLLRVIAGLVRPDTGRVLVDGADVTRLSSRRRNIGVVFQHYALFPHMTVAQNAAFGLKARRIPRREVSKHVDALLDVVGLAPHARKKPAQLSGGQQQRVALARALVIRPKILLMDEPFGALDLRLRQDMQEEVRRLQQQFGITTVSVTHDQDEAFSISDRVVVMSEGQIVASGGWDELYRRPTSRFIAEFIGHNTVIDVPVESGENGAIVGLPGQTRAFFLKSGESSRTGLAVVLNPDRIECSDQPVPGCCRATVTGRRFMGIGEVLTVLAEKQRFRLMDLPSRPPIGSDIFLRWDPRDARLVRKDSYEPIDIVVGGQSTGGAGPLIVDVMEVPAP